MPSAYSSESTAEAKASDFLSNVVGLDLTKYTLIPPYLPSNAEYPSNISESLQTHNLTRNDPFGGLVEQQVLSYDLEYNENKMDIMGIFYNGHMAFLKIYSYSQDDYVYSELPPTDIIHQARSILQRYQTFSSQNYAKDTLYLVHMQNILNRVNDLSPNEITAGNINFQVLKDGNNTRIQWIYTKGGVSMEWKRVSIKFRNNTFESFRDTWGLYTVSGLSKISSEEAVQIALEAAQRCEIRVNYDDRKTEIIKVPDLSNAPYDVNMYMVPFRYQESDIPSKMSRDPLTLYPYWQIHFYFNESIGGNIGVQVGIWGDTAEIIYCRGHGYLGVSGTPTSLRKNRIRLTP